MRWKIIPFYTWLLPLIWAGCSLVHFRFPGDEYGLYALASAAGTWIAFIFPFGDIHNPAMPLSIAVTGALVMAAAGYVMDRLRICRLFWAIGFAVSAAALLGMSIHAYPSVEKALSKNGSWQAYILFSVNMGLYCSVMAALSGRLIAAWAGRLRNPRRGEPHGGGPTD
jgi:hypothetical protein